MVPSCSAIAAAIRSAVPHVYRSKWGGKRHAQDRIDGKAWMEEHADVVRWCNSHTNAPGGWDDDAAGAQLQLSWTKPQPRETID